MMLTHDISIQSILDLRLHVVLKFSATQMTYILEANLVSHTCLAKKDFQLLYVILACFRTVSILYFHDCRRIHYFGKQFSSLYVLPEVISCICTICSIHFGFVFHYFGKQFYFLCVLPEVISCLCNICPIHFGFCF